MKKFKRMRYRSFCIERKRGWGRWGGKEFRSEMHVEGVERHSCRGRYFRWRICGQLGPPSEVVQCITQGVAINIIFSAQNTIFVAIGGNLGAKV